MPTTSSKTSIDIFFMAMKRLFGPIELRGGRVQVYGCSPGCILLMLLVSLLLTILLNLILEWL